MSWEHALAKEFKKRDNPETNTPWFSGECLSPVMEVDPDTGDVSYEGPLIISCYDGQVILKADRLKVLASAGQIHDGQTVALLGALFGGAAGSQKILVLGVMT